jgi:hypothetical protein
VHHRAGLFRNQVGVTSAGHQPGGHTLLPSATHNSSFSHALLRRRLCALLLLRLSSRARLAGGVAYVAAVAC